MGVNVSSRLGKKNDVPVGGGALTDVGWLELRYQRPVLASMGGVVVVSVATASTERNDDGVVVIKVGRVHGENTTRRC
jgi:hypothetical protein